MLVSNRRRPFVGRSRSVTWLTARITGRPITDLESIGKPRFALSLDGEFITAKGPPEIRQRWLLNINRAKHQSNRVEKKLNFDKSSLCV
jgi:hypothetical protein